MDQVEQHMLDEQIADAYDRMCFHAYELESVQRAIVSYQTSTIETLRGQVDHYKKQSEDFCGKLALYERDSKLMNDQYTAWIAIEKKKMMDEVNKAKEIADAESQRAAELGRALVLFKESALDNAKDMNDVLERDLESAISVLQRVRIESNPYAN